MPREPRSPVTSFCVFHQHSFVFSALIFQTDFESQNRRPRRVLPVARVAKVAATAGSQTEQDDARPHNVASSKVNAFVMPKQSTVCASSLPSFLSKDDTRVSWRCLRFRSVCHCNHWNRRGGEEGEQSKPSLIVQFTIVFYAQLKILTQPWHASADRWNVVVAALALPLALALALTATVAAARCSRGNNNKASCCRVIK